MMLQNVNPLVRVRDQDYPAGGRQLLHAVEVVVVFVFQWLVWVETKPFRSSTDRYKEETATAYGRVPISSLNSV